MYHIICEEGQKSFENFENALNRYRHFEKMIDNYKKKSKSEWKLTNFTMFFINSIFYEKILVIFSFLCHKFSQYKTELFINLNILDFSPLYSLTTRRIIIIKIINYIYNVRKSLVQKSNDSISSYTSDATPSPHQQYAHDEHRRRICYAFRCSIPRLCYLL
jgi:hypothetical protein